MIEDNNHSKSNDEYESHIRERLDEHSPGLSKKVNNYLNDPKSVEKARKILENESKLSDTLLRAEKRYQKLGEGPIDRMIEKSKSLWRLVKSYKRKEYTKPPVKTIIASVLALVYLVNPFDLLPDIIPILGQVDDALLLSLVLYALDSDIRKFMLWEMKGEPSEDDFEGKIEVQPKTTDEPS